MKATGVRGRRRSGATSVARRGGRADPAAEVPDLTRRIVDALAVGGDRLSPEARSAAQAALDRVGERAEIGLEHTVVALAGSTGSGKSSLFNALVGFDISTVGVRRPTTSHPVACAWSPGSDAVLDWLEVSQRHRTTRHSELDADHSSDLDGLVLLDMPDHDSRERSHRLDVDRLVVKVDMLVWVVDPQKYADDALHTDYLRRLQGHDDVLVVVLNQADRLHAGEPEEVLEDLRALLARDGLPEATLLMTSALTGDGVAELRSLVADAVASRAMAAAKARAELQDAVLRLRAEVGDDEADVDGLGGDPRLLRALSEAAGVPTVLAAVQGDYRRTASRSTGWPFTRWVSRLRPDPLKRLRLGDDRAGTFGVAPSDVRAVLGRSSLPAPSPAARSGVQLATRRVGEEAGEGLPGRWREAVAQAATPRDTALADALDQAVMGTPLRARNPIWWPVLGALQLLLALCAVAGLLWLAVLAVLGWAQLPVEAPLWGPVPIPLLLLVGGLGLGLLLGALARVLAGVGSRRRRALVEGRLDKAVGAVAQEHVRAPVEAVLARHRQTRSQLDAAGR